MGGKDGWNFEEVLLSFHDASLKYRYSEVIPSKFQFFAQNKNFVL
jgi:hypothetical protein